MPMKWTDELPTETGYYWMRRECDLPGASEIVHVSIERGVRASLVSRVGVTLTRYLDAERGMLWCGPINLPD